MSRQELKFQLSQNIERFLASLSKIYANDRRNKYQEILVNSQVSVHEGEGYENFGEIRYGHDLHLAVPEVLYLDIAKEKSEIENQIKSDLNNIHNIRDEFIEHVFL